MSRGANVNIEQRQTQVIEQHLLSYLMGMQELREASDGLKRLLESMLDEQAIKYHLVESRAKSFDSYQSKSAKQNPDGTAKYRRLPHDVQDCIAARIIVFTETDRDRVLEEIRLRFTVVDGEDRNPRDERPDALQPGWGYDSHHFIVCGVDEAYPLESHALARFLVDGRCFEIQVRTVASHAWAEYEHDVRYKPERLDLLSAESKGVILGLFRGAAEHRIMIDRIFSDIERLLSGPETPRRGTTGASGPTLDIASSENQLDVGSLQQRLAELYPDSSSSKPTAMEWMLRVLAAARLHTTHDLDAVIAQADSARVAEVMDYRTPASRIRRLDDDLLSVMGNEYVELTSDVADNDAARDRRRRYLPARLNRLNGKLRIYSVQAGTGEEAPLTTAAGAVRELATIVVSSRGADEALLEGFIAREAEELAPAARANRWKFATGDELWMHGNLSRASAEIAMEALVQKVSDTGVLLRRSGDVLFPRSPETSAAD